MSKYKINVPAKSDWSQYAQEIQDRVNAGCLEPELQAYLAQNPWILLVVFGNSEGFVFTEYLIGDDEKTDFLVICGNSFPEVHLIELKGPTAKLFTKEGKMADKFNEGVMQSINRAFMLLNNNDYHQKRFRKQTADVFYGRDADYQGRYAGPVDSNFTIPFPPQKECSWLCHLVIGTNKEDESESMFRSRFKNEFRISVTYWDHIIKILNKHV